jgi:hypothetical protein
MHVCVCVRVEIIVNFYGDRNGTAAVGVGIGAPTHGGSQFVIPYAISSSFQPLFSSLLLS